MRAHVALLSALAALVVVLPGCVTTAPANPRATTSAYATLPPDTAAAAARLCPGKVRVHYIAADEVNWTYAPSGYNIVEDEPYEPHYAIYTDKTDTLIGLTYRKAVYREYTDANFTHLMPVDPQWQHRGIVGPILHAEVGDTVVVHFRNHAKRPYSIHVHGLLYEKDSEGAPYNDGGGNPEGWRLGQPSNGDWVNPGDDWMYVWHATPRSGPGPMDPSSVFWMYHSHVNEVFDVFSGLVGGVVVTKCGMANPDGSPKDVDREMVAYFSIIDENQSWYVNESLALSGKDPAQFDTSNEEFMEGNLKHTINGYMFGAGASLMHVTAGQHVRWYVFDLGNEVDSHTPHWHGQTLLQNGMRTDMTSVMPGDMRTLDMVPDTPGTWLFHCHVDDHLEAGMVTMYTVDPA